MDKYFLRQFILIIVICSAIETKTYLDDYCWRDYDGTLPADALEAGLDKSGKPIYVGQVINENKLIPGKIYQNDDKIYFEWNNKEYSTNKNVKILCSQQPKKFVWIPTKSDQISNLNNMILIKGGFEPNYSTYIGKTVTDGENSVGKIICSTDNCLGLFTTTNVAVRRHQTYQILGYNPEGQSTDVNCKPFIDIAVGVGK